MRDRKKVVVAGQICVDISPAFPGGPVSRVEELISPGKITAIGPAVMTPGGCVSNTGLAMRRLGADVTLIGKIGRDDFGRALEAQIGASGVNAHFSYSDDRGTSYTLVLAPAGLDRMLLHYSGANDTFDNADLDFSALADCALFHFGYPPILRRYYQNDGVELLRLMKKLHEFGAATSMDMVMLDPRTESGRLDWTAYLKKILPHIDIFCPSFEEILYMLDRPKYARLNELSQGGDMLEIVRIKEDVEPLAARLLAFGCKIVLIKCGKKGLYYVSAEAERLRTIPERLGLNSREWGGKTIFQPAYRPERVVSALGAGDTAIAAFLTAILEDYAAEEALRYAAATGALCVQTGDTLGGLLPFEALQTRLTAGWETID